MSYENDALRREIERLRAVAREYEYFLSQINSAFEKKDWDAVEFALGECE